MIKGTYIFYENGKEVCRSKNTLTKFGVRQKELDKLVEEKAKAHINGRINICLQALNGMGAIKVTKDNKVVYATFQNVL